MQKFTTKFDTCYSTHNPRNKILKTKNNTIENLIPPETRCTNEDKQKRSNETFVIQNQMRTKKIDLMQVHVYMYMYRANTDFERFKYEKKNFGLFCRNQFFNSTYRFFSTSYRLTDLLAFVCIRSISNRQSPSVDYRYILFIRFNYF